MPDKQYVRAERLAARRAMTASARRAADKALVAAATTLVAGARAIAAYAPMPGEPGGAGLVDALAAAVDMLILPVLLADLDLDWARYEPGGLLAAAGRSWREPAGPRLGVSAIAGVDMVLVPALAVDQTGTRLGRGGGCYDRALARVDAGTPVLALLYPGELLDALTRQAHDRPVTGVLLPSGLQPVPPSRPSPLPPKGGREGLR